MSTVSCISNINNSNHPVYRRWLAANFGFVLPKFFLQLLSLSFCLKSSYIYCLFALFFATVAVAATTNTGIDATSCLASLHPQSLIARRFSNINVAATIQHQIRCSARLASHQSFVHPVFDLSFGLTPLTGLYIVRSSQKQCSPDNTFCWSDFKIRTQALHELLLSSTTNDDEDNDSGNNISGVSHTASFSSSMISFTCNVADSPRNSTFPVRCSDTGSIQYASVLNHADRCSSTINAADECGPNMVCQDNQCQCIQGFMPYTLGPSETICVRKAAIGERCNFTRQCRQLNADSLCEFDSLLKFKICKCLSGFEEVHASHNKLYCASIIVSSTTSTSGLHKSSDEIEMEKVEEENSTLRKDQADREARILAKDVDDDDKFDAKKWLLTRLGQVNLHGIALFAAAILIAVILVIIIIRFRNRGEMKVKNKNEKPRSGGKTNGPLLAAIHRTRLSDDDEEEIDVRIDECMSSNDERSTTTDKDDHTLIDCERNSEETDLDTVNRSHSCETYLDASSSRVSSASNVNQTPQSAINYNYSAKQSVV